MQQQCSNNAETMQQQGLHINASKAQNEMLAEPTRLAGQCHQGLDQSINAVAMEQERSNNATAMLQQQCSSNATAMLQQQCSKAAGRQQQCCNSNASTMQQQHHNSNAAMQ